MTIEDSFDPPLPDLLAETAHDSETLEVFLVRCPICDEQYEVEIVASLAGYQATLASEASVPVNVRVDGEFDDAADRWDIPSPEPLAVYKEADRELVAFLEDLSRKPQGATGSSLPRMAFVHLFSMIEAYLADTVIGLCARDKDVRLRVVRQLRELKNISFSLAEIESDEDLVRKTVSSHLRMRQFHKFSFVDELYQIATRTRILPSEKAARDFLFAAVAMRHDCVHRNGRDPDGKIHEIHVRQVLELAERFRSIVANVQATVDKIDETREELLARARDLPFADDLPF